jgi:hypothetical protein
MYKTRNCVLLLVILTIECVNARPEIVDNKDVLSTDMNQRNLSEYYKVVNVNEHTHDEHINSTNHPLNHHHGGIHVASWKFDFVKRPLILSLFVLALVIVIMCELFIIYLFYLFIFIFHFSTSLLWPSK